MVELPCSPNCFWLSDVAFCGGGLLSMKSSSSYSSVSESESESRTTMFPFRTALLLAVEIADDCEFVGGRFDAVGFAVKEACREAGASGGGNEDETGDVAALEPEASR